MEKELSYIVHLVQGQMFTKWMIITLYDIVNK